MIRKRNSLMADMEKVLVSGQKLKPATAFSEAKTQSRERA